MPPWVPVVAAVAELGVLDHSFPALTGLKSATKGDEVAWSPPCVTRRLASVPSASVSPFVSCA